MNTKVILSICYYSRFLDHRTNIDEFWSRRRLDVGNPILIHHNLGMICLSLYKITIVVYHTFINRLIIDTKKCNSKHTKSRKLISLK